MATKAGNANNALAVLMAGKRNPDSYLAADRERKAVLKAARTETPLTYNQHALKCKRDANKQAVDK